MTHPPAICFVVMRSSFKRASSCNKRAAMQTLHRAYIRPFVAINRTINEPDAVAAAAVAAAVFLFSLNDTKNSLPSGSAIRLIRPHYGP